MCYTVARRKRKEAIEVKYRFADWKDGNDTPMLEIGKLYDGVNDDGQLVDIYDGEKFLGTYCVERFEKIGGYKNHESCKSNTAPDQHCRWKR